MSILQYNAQNENEAAIIAQINELGFYVEDLSLSYPELYAEENAQVIRGIAIDEDSSDYTSECYSLQEFLEEIQDMNELFEAAEADN